MFREVFLFELRLRLRQPLFYLFGFFFFLLAFSAVSSDSVQVGGAVGNVARNAPFVIYTILGSLSAIGLIVVTLFVTTAVNRDHEQETQELLLSTPLTKWAYLGGRFAGSILPTALAVSFGAVGMMTAARMPWQDPSRIVPFSILPYAQALLLFVLPNLFFAGALFFSVATLTRRVLLGWVAVVAFFTLWGISLAFLGDLEHVSTAVLLDPFGLAGMKLATRYWTVAEKNTRLLPLAGPLLWNRLLWTAVGCGILLLTHARYRMSLSARSSTLRRRAPPPTGMVAGPPAEQGAGPLPRAIRRFGPSAQIRQWLHLTGAETASILRGIPFLVLALMCVMNLAGSLVADFDGTHSYPVTRNMLRTIHGTTSVFLFLVLAIYGGSLMWKEKRAKLHEVFASLPLPNWVFLASKLGALVVASALLLSVSMMTTMVYQLVKGYAHPEIGLYFKELFLVSLSEWILVAVLALGVHVLTNNMNLGFLLIVLYDLVVEYLPELGVEHKLLLYGTTPRVVYSDMNGYGPFLGAMIWFKVYWAFLAAGLLVIWNLLWVRSTDAGIGQRLREVRRRLFSGRTAGWRQAALALSLIGFLASGLWVFYNTNVRNKFETSRRRTQIQALYEQRYKQYEGLPQPRVKKVRVEADIEPEAPRVDLRGSLHAVNESGQPIRRLHLVMDRDVLLRSLDLPAHTIEVDDREVGYLICRLEEPIPPGAELDLGFDLTVRPRGFVNSRPNTRVVRNGVFFDNTQYVPRFGYNREGELDLPKDRRRFHLPPRARAHPLGDPEGGRRMAFSGDADWIEYEAILSTSSDQTALAPGRLERTWTETGRRYFQYRGEGPMANFYSFQSGRYAVARDTWKDVAIEVFYHPAHPFNVGRMIESVQKSLDYYSANFGPYQGSVIRIAEFPGYRTFAQSFPTQIPYSETAHFINDLRDKKNIDMVFYITAHEVAHQWWGHQVMPGDVQGATMIIESLAQYSAYMVMEKAYGRRQMRRFLAYELDRYLKGRGNERIGEQPLCLVENQPYIHYYKGGLALYALRDYIGEEAMNGALREFLGRAAFRDPPYPDTAELLQCLRAATPEEFASLITDLFETITLYDNRAETAEAEDLGDGKYRVRLTLQSRKYRADEKGAETELPHHDWIEVGVLGEDPGGGESGDHYLYLEKRRLTSGTNQVEIVVDAKPVRAGIDPRNLLVDRVAGDNVKRISD